MKTHHSSLRFKNDFEKRYTHLEDLLYTASALGPHFKTPPFLSDDDAERIFISISAEATALLNKEAGVQTARDTFRGIQCRETLLIEIHTTGQLVLRSRMSQKMMNLCAKRKRMQHWTSCLGNPLKSEQQHDLQERRPVRSSGDTENGILCP